MRSNDIYRNFRFDVDFAGVNWMGIARLKINGMTVHIKLSAALILILLSQFISGCDGSSADTELTSNEYPSMTTINTVTQGDAHEVHILAEFFEPAEISIKPGDTVTWVNMDVNAHSVTSIYHYQDEDDVSHIFLAETWDSGHIQSGQSYSKTFNHEGTFEYIRMPMTVRTPLDQYFEFTAQKALGVVVVQ